MATNVIHHFDSFTTQAALLIFVRVDQRVHIVDLLLHLQSLEHVAPTAFQVVLGNFKPENWSKIRR